MLVLHGAMMVVKTVAPQTHCREERQTLLLVGGSRTTWPGGTSSHCPQNDGGRKKTLSTGSFCTLLHLTANQLLSCQPSLRFYSSQCQPDQEPGLVESRAPESTGGWAATDLYSLQEQMSCLNFIFIRRVLPSYCNTPPHPWPASRVRSAGAASRCSSDVICSDGTWEFNWTLKQRLEAELMRLSPGKIWHKLVLISLVCFNILKPGWV